MWHPASLLLSWLGFALVLAWLPLLALLAMTVLTLVLAFCAAPARSRSLFWRSRWLLLSLAILFLFVTPGEYLPGAWGRIGLTHEGLRQSAEQLGRLLAMLASLALLHERVGTQGLLLGLYCLLRPFPWRDETVVRLMLVLEFVEQKPASGWREWLVPEADRMTEGLATYSLAMPPLQWRDRFLMGVWLVAAMAWMAWR